MVLLVCYMYPGIDYFKAAYMNIRWGHLSQRQQLGTLAFWAHLTYDETCFGIPSTPWDVVFYNSCLLYSWQALSPE